jgi:hypothetical protein
VRLVLLNAVSMSSDQGAKFQLARVALDLELCGKRVLTFGARFGSALHLNQNFIT